MIDATTLTQAPFIYSGIAVRVVMIDGEPWFVLADLCKVLDIANVGNVADRLDELNIRRTDVENSRGQIRSTVVVNEPGMYEVVIRSDKPEAVAFRRWITGAVLPEIRRTGSFNTRPALEGPELLATAVLEAQRMLAEKDERIAELEPKADLADDYLLAQGGARLVREVAKTLGWREKDFRRWLLDEKLIFARHAPCGAVQYDFYAQHAHHFQTREKVVEHQWGTCSHYTLQILPRGVELIHRRIREQQR